MSKISTFYAFKFLRMLTKDFRDWKAYELGLIDEDGNTIREAETKEEKEALNSFNKIVKNIKKQIEKVPGLGSTLGSFAAAAYLMKEEGYEDIAEEIMLIKDLNEQDLEQYGNELLNETTTTAAVPTGANIGPMPDGHAAGMAWFDVSDDVFQKAGQGKKKKKHWRKFVQYDENAERIRQYARKNPTTPMMFRNRKNQSEFVRVQ